jgi:tetratricopeptide (TPR) repeat protein
MNSLKMENFEKAKQFFLDGIACIERQNYMEAERDFLHSLELIPERASTLTNLAASQMMLGKIDEALTNARKAVSIDPNSYEALINLGRIEKEGSEFDRAIDAFKRATVVDPGPIVAWVCLAEANDTAGNLDESVKCYKKAILRNPKDFVILSNIGALLNDKMDFQDALPYHEKCLEINPTHHQTLINKGIALRGLIRLPEALDAFDQALKLNPSDAECWFRKGITLQELGRFDDALAHYSEAISLKPDFAEAWANKGCLLVKRDCYQDALEVQGEALKLDSSNPENWSNMAIALQGLGRLDEALLHCEQAIRLEDDHRGAWTNKVSILYGLGKYADALEASYRALSLDSSRPANWFNKANALHRLVRLEEALTCFDTAICMDPDYYEAYYNRGNLFRDLKRFDAAIESYDRAIKLKPDYADANFNKAVVELLCGNLSSSTWDLYEWRFRVEDRSEVKKHIANDWTRDRIKGGSLLVLPEQGLGDEIFYAGILNDVRSFADEVTVCADPRLLPIYRRSFDGLKFVSRGSAVMAQKYDAQIYLGSLCRYFRAGDKALENIKAPYLKACSSRVKKMRNLLAGDGELICGLSWLSKNNNFGKDKSLDLQDLHPLFLLPDVKIVDLQYGDTREEQAIFEKASGRNLTSVPQVDKFNDIDGLAALIEACDVVVTVSNTTAHLAGALGKPVFVMLPYSSGLIWSGLLWYWHIDREDSPWYPSAKLFRQERAGDWAGTVARVRESLAKLHHTPLVAY